MRRMAFTIVAALLIMLAASAASSAVEPECQPRPGQVVSKVFVRVLDRNYLPVDGLQAGDFIIERRGKASEACEARLVKEPVSVGILIDNSGSMRPEPPTVSSATPIAVQPFDALGVAREAIAQLLAASGPQDEFFLEHVSEGPAMQCLFTCDLRSIRSGLNPTTWGRTALFDGIYLALHAMRKARHLNRVLLAVTDGGENASVYDAKDLKKALRDLPVPVFVLVPVAQTPTGRYGTYPQDESWPQLNRLSRSSGGLVVIASDVRRATAGGLLLNAVIRHRYLVGFYGEAGKDIRVKLKRDKRLRDLRVLPHLAETTTR